MSGPDKPRRGRRVLGPDERRLWDRVASATKPIRGRTSKPVDPDIDVPDVSIEGPERIEVPAPRSPAPVLKSRPIGKSPRQTVTFHSQGPEVGPVGRPEAGLDRRTSDRLRKGAREPDARIDLHGMTAERAHRACLTFLSDAMARGLRVVLVITGKGGMRHNDDFMVPTRGVLRESLPGWLRASPLGSSIVGIYQAHQKHGGAGAFYVYLKRRR